MVTDEIVDCVASYFGFGDDGEMNRYFCYHVIGGPGPTPGAGVASVVPLAVFSEAERCIGCRNFHVVPTGGPAAAVEKALRYLDSYHEGDRLRKVQTALRDLSSDNGAPPCPPPASGESAAGGGPPPFGAGSARAPAAFTEFIFPGKRGS